VAQNVLRRRKSLGEVREHGSIQDANLYWLRERFRSSSTVAEAMQSAMPAAGLCSEKDHKTHRVLWRVMLFHQPLTTQAKCLPIVEEPASNVLCLPALALFEKAIQSGGGNRGGAGA
jgi:hypothetical protein